MAYRRILVPVDGSDTANHALTHALNLARDSGGQLHLVHSVDELAYATGFEVAPELIQIARDNGAKVLEEGLERARAAGVAADSRLMDAPGQRLGELVADEARGWGADLVVVGTHGRRGIGRVLLGSGAEQIIRLAPVPVLAVRGERQAG